MKAKTNKRIKYEYTLKKGKYKGQTFSGVYDMDAKKFINSNYTLATK